MRLPVSVSFYRSMSAWAERVFLFQCVRDLYNDMLYSSMLHRSRLCSFRVAPKNQRSKSHGAEAAMVQKVWCNQTTTGTSLQKLSEVQVLVLYSTIDQLLILAHRCIPKMDHHCPWTVNCVSYRTFPHYFRFLFYAVTTMTYLERLLYTRIAHLWASRNLPSVCALLYSL